MTDVPQRLPVRRVTEVPRSSKPPGEIKRLKGNQQITGAILSPTFWGVRIHFCERSRRSSGCRKDPSTCQGCIDKIPSKNRWYLYLWTGGRDFCHVELTDGAAGQLIDAMAGKKSFRGTRVTIHRTAADKGRLNITVLEIPAKEESLPADKDPVELLEWLWQYRRFNK